MKLSQDIAGFCRDCDTSVAAPGPCPSCGGRRILSHPELLALSIAHVDCDAFYASIEKRDNPELKHKPVIVGGGKRGVVSAACYQARVYGVRSAMPMFKALKACPNAVVVKPDITKYAREGRRIKDMMLDLTPAIQPLSIDEAFLDLTGTERLHGAPPALSLIRLQRRILDKVGVTVSVGLSYNKFLAKTASDLDKPNGFAVIGQAEALDFLADKPVDFIFGVGPSFARWLNKDGLKTIADIRRVGDSIMAAKYGEGGLRLSRLARAEDYRPVRDDDPRKSVSSEWTFHTDVRDPKELADRLWRACVKTADAAKAKGLAGRVVTLKIKRSDFKSVTRRRTLMEPTQLADTIYQTLEPFLLELADGTAYRLIGAGISDLTAPMGDAADLLDPQAVKRAAAERASDIARAKFGADAVVKGRQFRLGGKKKPENGDKS